MKNNLKKYTLGLCVAGRIQFVLDIYETDIRKAKNEWARLTGHYDNLWDKKSMEYFSWPVVETVETALERKATGANNYFPYY